MNDWNEALEFDELLPNVSLIEEDEDIGSAAECESLELEDIGYAEECDTLELEDPKDWIFYEDDLDNLDELLSD